jgi:hypothetical protein
MKKTTGAGIPRGPALSSGDDRPSRRIVNYRRDIPRTALFCFAQFWQSLTCSMEIAPYAYDVGVFRVEYEDQKT